MWANKSFLKSCYELDQLGFKFPFEEGRRIARGFADVGFEEYCSLPNAKAISLPSGRVISIPIDEQRFFFGVPSADEVINEIEKLGFDILRIETEDQRNWKVTWCAAEGDKSADSLIGRSVEEVLLAALRKVFNQKRGHTLRVMS